MNWGKVTYVFFALMSLTTIGGFFYDQNGTALFIAASVNLISTLLKIGVRNVLAAELFASSLVSDLHLIPAFVILMVRPENMVAVISFVIGAAIANIFSLVLIVVESAKSKDDF